MFGAQRQDDPFLRGNVVGVRFLPFDLRGDVGDDNAGTGVRRRRAWTRASVESPTA